MLKKHIVAWVFGTIIMLIYNWVSEDRSVTTQFTNERSMIIDYMGDGSAGRIQQSTNTIYAFCCNILADLTYEIFVPRSNDSMGFKEKMISSHEAFWTSIYIAISRLMVIGEWLVVFWVVILASFNQGLTVRAIRVANLDWISSVKYHLGFHYLVGIVGLFVNYILWPWAVHPYLAAIVCMVMTGVAFIISSNIQGKV